MLGTKHWRNIVGSFFISLGIYVLNNISGVNFDNEYLIYYGLIFFGVYQTYKYSNKSSLLPNWLVYSVSLIISVVLFLSISFILYGNLTLLKSNKVATIICIFSLGLLVKNICLIVLNLFAKDSLISDKEEYVSWKRIFSILVLCWLIYFLPYLPGSIAGDGNYQLSEYFGYVNDAMSNHQPYVTTLFEGVIFQIGRHINDNFGLFLYAVIQIIITSTIYSYCIKKLSQFRLKRTAVYSLTFLVGLLPYWSLLAPTLQKDTLFIAFFGLFVMNVLEVIDAVMIRNKPVTNKLVLKLIITGLLVSFWRNNGIVEVLPTLIALVLIANRKYWKKFLVASIIILGIYGSFEKIVMPSLGVVPTEKREAFSLPMQQTARYMKYHADDLNSVERSELRKTFYNYKKLGELYNPYIADSVKVDMRLDFDSATYLKAWVSMGIKHPITYLQATFGGTYLYYSPQIRANSFVWCSEIADYARDSRIKINQFAPKKFRDAVTVFITNIANFPLVNILINDALCVWVSLLMFLVFIYKKKYAFAIPFIPIALNVLVCIASPVDGLNRYSGCIVFTTYCIALLFGLWIKQIGNVEQGKAAREDK